MYTVCFVVAVLVLCWLAIRQPRTPRRTDEDFNRPHRRRWWQPRWAFPDDE